MTKRTGFRISSSVSAASQPPPREVVAAITVELHVAWPEGMGHEGSVRDLITESYEKALEELDKHAATHQLVSAE